MVRSSDDRRDVLELVADHGLVQGGVELRPLVDRGGEFPYARAFLNRELKHGLINDCMTDVVVYGGPNGAAIRLAAEEALCNALGGSYVGADCSVPHGEAPGALAFIAESLGSKLLFDAVLEVWSDAENGRDKAVFERVAKGLAGTRMIYMMANQLPLLDVAGPAIGFVNGAPGPQRPTSGSIARDVFDLLSRLRAWTPSGAGPMTVVAFSDPNDLLSYRVVPSHLAGSLKRVPHRQCDRVQRHDVLRLRRASRQGSLRLRPQSPCAEHDCAGISGRETVARRSRACRAPARISSACPTADCERSAVVGPAPGIAQPQPHQQALALGARASRGTPCACGRARGCR